MRYLDMRMISQLLSSYGGSDSFTLLATGLPGLGASPGSAVSKVLRIGISRVEAAAKMITHRR
jgi:hypothetical protein